VPATFERHTGSPIGYFAPSPQPPAAIAAFSMRGALPPGERFPTSYLARELGLSLGLGQIPMVRASQTHGTEVRNVKVPPAEGEVADAGAVDILATGLAGIALVIQTADCVPILLAAPEAVAAVHAGWRGSSEGGARTGVEALVRLGAHVSEIRAYLGPSIGACCYEVGLEVASRFEESLLHPGPKGRPHLDLAEANRRQLIGAGISPEAIAQFSGCTRCGGEQFASYRRDGTRSGRMIALIARRPNGT
jgi:purine-nucleoside/S-methyl-5'-thioadenosine phosphorylase / adenosine deaminase